MSKGTHRRLAAIVSTDVVGYSRLMGADETGTLAALRALRAELTDPLIAEHGGRIVKTMGDGLLLEFASVVNAVRFSIETQNRMAARNEDVPIEKRIILRIGVNVGDIIIEGEDIFGDGVNVAARLQEIAEGGGIAVSGRVYEDVQNRLDADFEDAGEQTLKNIARPVRVWSWPHQSGGGERPAKASKAPPKSEKPSVAVLPFVNLSDDKEQEFLADGMMEDVITGLSLNRHLSVVSRTSTFALKGRPFDIRDVAADLGAGYVVEGSVRRVANRVRTTVQLIEARSGNHIWADKYDRRADEIFDVQDEVISNITGALGAQLTTAEFERARQITPDDLTSWEAVQRALATYSSDALNPATLPGIIADLRIATESDPDYAYAHSVLAWTLSSLVTNGYSSDLRADVHEGEKHLNIGIALGGDDPLNLFYCGAALIHFGRQPQAIDLLNRSLERNPNAADVLLYLGVAYGYAGEFDKAGEALDKAEAMAPTGGFALAHSFYRSKVKFLEGDFEAAVKLGERYILSQPKFGAAHVFYAMCHELMGRREMAEKSMVRALKASPQLRFKTLAPYIAAHPDIEEGKRRYSVLRKLWPATGTD